LYAGRIGGEKERTSNWEAAKVRWLAAEILGHIGPDAKDAVPALIKALQDDDAHVRAVAATTLGIIGPVAMEVEPVCLAWEYILWNNFLPILPSLFLSSTVQYSKRTRKNRVKESSVFLLPLPIDVPGGMKRCSFSRKG
jgi:hypothetical protein